ncbi:biotin-dependent carboxyltransferase family protein [Thermoanaerobacterium thermosaccharolyticum]|uniref:biotin-dependent carboxyltransferase family protein n=1 Tax=Thermoanaerobacterium thermosaccharolyticum TaxID=1517 RepID=UPI0037D9D78F
MKYFKVLNPGLFTTVQDMGRFGYESQGVPTSGAMDEFALRIANILVENDENAPCLEITLMGPTFKVLNDAMIAVTGAEIQPLVNGFPRSCWSSFPVQKGDIVSFRPIKSGCRAYLAVAGGFKGDFIMNSVSTYTRGKLGGINGRQIEKDDVLKGGVSKPGLQAKKVRDEYIPSYSNEEEIRVILGPQDDYFSEEAVKIFLTSTYVITKDSDRMGYRLEGPEIKAKEGHEIKAKEGHDIITDGILPGAIQIPGNGKPIVILKDAQTTGGYKKIATVISFDLSKLAQLKPGDKIRFRTVDLTEAHKILAEAENKIKKIKETLKVLKYYKVKVNERYYDVGVEPL